MRKEKSHLRQQAATRNGRTRQKRILAHLGERCVL